MTDRPIIFSGPMVRALLEGRKTQTRRILKPQPASLHDKVDAVMRYAIGDRLWVRENWCHFPDTAPDGMGEQYYYQASNSPDDPHRARIVEESMRRNGVKWRPSIHMPRSISRLTLTVTRVRVERLKDISVEDAKAEGVWTAIEEPMRQSRSISHIGAYAAIWDSIHGPGEWEQNPWVVALTFTVEKRNIDNWRLVA